MDAQLERLGLAQRYQRFSAVDGNALGLGNSQLSAGELGCFTSHYELLPQHLDSTAHMHITEDDAVLAKRTAQFVEWVITSGMIDDHDLIFTDMAVPLSLYFYHEARSRYDSLIDRDDDGTASKVRFSTVEYNACTTSYLVNGRSIGLICDMLGRELASGACDPIDILIRHKVAEGKLRARAVFPFITSIKPGGFDGTIAGGDRDQLSGIVLDLLRHSFFVDCDLAAALDLADQRLPASDAGTRDRLFERALGFMTSGAFKPP